MKRKRIRQNRDIIKFCILAGLLAALYLVCYFLREILEARMMGGAAGLSPLETLMAMYAGLRLFGLAGLFLGPAGLLIIREFALKTS